MGNNPGSEKQFSRRAAILAGGQVTLLTALVGRLYFLQVVESDQYKMLAEDNRINMRLLPPPRGRVLDRFGEPLALNRQDYRVVLIAEQTPSVEATLDALSQVIALSPYERRRVLREVARNRAFVPITVRNGLSWSEVSRIEVHAPDLPGATIEVGQSRAYPLGPMAAHIVGYVGVVSESELSSDPLLRLPEFRVGKSGTEKVYDIRLRGSAGSSQVEVNAFGRVIRELQRQDGQPGDDLVLTIDGGLQRYVSNRLGEESAAAVVLDIHGGEVLAIASTPSYNPNDFNQGLSRATWSALLGDRRTPLVNKAVAGQYPPGSTFKMMVVLAALEDGIVTTGHTVYCSGHMWFGDRRFHCWKRGGHGKLAMLEAIQKSCDVYFYDLARRLDVDRIAAMARRFGLGAPTGIDLPSESVGLVPTKAWKAAARGVPWQKGENLIIAIGQGSLLTTPLQLAVMAARIGNGGIAVRPHLLREVRSGEVTETMTPPAFEPIGVAKAHLEFVKEGMNRVTNHLGGTAYGARITRPGMEMAGKTGTVQVRRISKGERIAGLRKNKDKPWEERDHALFVAFAPVEKPRYAAAVVVEHGGSGSKVAAPIARDVLIEAQRRVPTEVATPEGTPAPSGGDAG